MTSNPRDFYDAFSSTFVRDYVRGNRRVDRQLEFVSAATPSNARRALVIGCGSGESSVFLAELLPDSHVLGVDLSPRNIELANRLFPHPRVTYRVADMTRDALDGEQPFDVILLPDVYEHIPVDARGTLHRTLRRLLTSRGRILLTLPSPGKQKALAESGEGLQPVDETITLSDLSDLANAVDADLTHFNLVSIWDSNDYVHAVVERGSGTLGPLDSHSRIPLKGWPSGRAPELLSRSAAFTRRLVRRALRKVHVKRRLK